MIQIGDKNCVNVVEVVEGYLRTGKIIKAKPLVNEDIIILTQKYGRSFKTEKPIKLNDVLKNGDRGIIYAIREKKRAIINGELKQRTIGHVFNFIKENGKLLYKDGQNGSDALFQNQRYIEYQYMKIN